RGLVKSRCSASFMWLVALLFAAQPAVSKAQTTTTEEPHRSLFTWRDALLAGGFVVGTIAIRPLDKNAAATFQSPTRQGKWYLQKAALGLNRIAVPGALIIGTTMYAAGRFSGNRRLAQLGLHGTEALFIGEGVAVVGKYTFGRAR